MIFCRKNITEEIFLKILKNPAKVVKIRTEKKCTTWYTLSIELGESETSDAKTGDRLNLIISINIK